MRLTRITPYDDVIVCRTWNDADTFNVRWAECQVKSDWWVNADDGHAYGLCAACRAAEHGLDQTTNQSR